MITFIKPGINREADESITFINMLYGNSVEISFSHLDVRGMVAYRGGISKNEPVFYNNTKEGSVYSRPMKLYMDFPKVNERLFDSFINTIVKASDRGTAITMINTYDSLQFPIEYEMLYGMEKIPARHYEGFIFDFKHKYNRDVWRIGENKQVLTSNGPYSPPRLLPYEDQTNQANIIERSVDLSIVFISGTMVVKNDD